MLTTINDLANLPEPAIIEELSFEAILARRKDTFALAAQARGLDLGQFLMLESSTETILLEEASYSELLMRSRANKLYRASLLYFSTGTELDHVAEESGVTRLIGETDAQLRTRVRIKNRGSSSAGPDDWWRYFAMTADKLVQDVAVTRADFPFPAPTQKRGEIYLSILSTADDGVPTPATLAAVTRVVNSTAVRGTTTTPIVRAATSKTFNVGANVWLLPTAQQSVFDSLEATFRSVYAKTRALGFDINPSWVVAQLQQPGVQRVELTSPTAIVPVADWEAPLLTSVSLNLAGRAY
jgi:phage-related baseplate assembly protein